MMTNDDPEGLIFLSHPHTNNDFFFLLNTEFIVFYFSVSSQKFLNKLVYNIIRELLESYVYRLAKQKSNKANLLNLYPW